MQPLADKGQPPTQAPVQVASLSGLWPWARSRTLAGVSVACRYGSIYGALCMNSAIREMNFKANFILWLFVELLWFALQLTFNSVLYLHTESIAGWTKWEVVLLIGTSHFTQQLFQALFLVNCAQLSDLVHSGRLDFMMLFPINTRFLVSLRQVDLGGFMSAASGLAVVVYAAQQLQLNPGLLELIGYAGLCLAAICVHYSLMFIMATVSFWTVRAQGLVMAYYNLFSIARLPDSAFRGSFKGLFTLCIPMLLVANVPAKVLARKLSSPGDVALLLAMCGMTLLASKLVWSQAMRRYTSASS